MSSKAKSSASFIPEKRFPGFSEPWAHEPLSSVLTEHKVKNEAGHEVFSVSMESGIVNQIEHLGRSFAAADTSHYNVGHRFDVVYTKSPLKAFPFGIVKQCKFEGEVALSPLYGVFTPKNRHVGLMIEAFFEAPERAQAFLSPLCQKGAKNTLQITNATFISGKMALPKEEGEQQKIADCLDSADSLIAAQGRKVEALRAHKKGLMQQLFPQEGETQPRLRFPEFEGTGEWAMKEVGRIAEVAASGDLDKDNFSAEQTENYRFPVFANGVEKGGLYGFSSVATHRANSITITARGTLGRAFLRKTDFVGIGRLVVVSDLKRDISPRYFMDCWEHLAVIPHEVTSIPQLTAITVRKIKLPFPSLTEQQRIADCLTSLDDLIDAETRKLDTLKTHKKGLMQQLFPQVGEGDA